MRPPYIPAHPIYVPSVHYLGYLNYPTYPIYPVYPYQPIHPILSDYGCGYRYDRRRDHRYDRRCDYRNIRYDLLEDPDFL